MFFFAWGGSSRLMRRKRTITIGLSLLAVLCMAGSLALYHSNGLRPPVAQAASPGVSLAGYAWSSNIGWIHFSGTNYSVVEQPDGTLTGYAYSSNIGWINFAPTDFTGTGCTGSSCAPHVDTVTGAVTGWARACAALADKLNCSGSSLDATGGGWDGWIHLSAPPSAPNYSVTKNADCTYSGYSWGGQNIGWIEWNPNVGGGVNGGIGCDAAPTITLTYTPDPVTFTDTGPISLAWTTQNAATCGPLTENGVTIGAAPLLVQETNYPATVNAGPNTFVLTCRSLGGTPNTGSVIVDVPASGVPSATMTLTPTPPTVQRGSPSTLQWGIPSSIVLSTCEITGPGGFVDNNITTRTGSTVTGNIINTSTFTLSCTGATNAQAVVHIVSSPVEPPAGQ